METITKFSRSSDATDTELESITSQLYALSVRDTLLSDEAIVEKILELLTMSIMRYTVGEVSKALDGTVMLLQSARGVCTIWRRAAARPFMRAHLSRHLGTVDIFCSHFGWKRADALKEMTAANDMQIAGADAHAVNWLVAGFENGFNSILSDELGAGYDGTVASVAMLRHLIKHGIKGPFMVVAPTHAWPKWLEALKPLGLNCMAARDVDEFDDCMEAKPRPSLLLMPPRPLLPGMEEEEGAAHLLDFSVRTWKYVVFDDRELTSTRGAEQQTSEVWPLRRKDRILPSDFNDCLSGNYVQLLHCPPPSALLPLQSAFAFCSGLRLFSPSDIAATLERYSLGDPDLERWAREREAARP